MSVRCKAKTKKNRRCSLHTKRGKYCWIHLKYQFGLRVKQSNIPNAGLGLYTLKEIKSNHKIVDYKGKLNNPNPNFTYTLQIDSRNHIDASEPTSGVGRFANDCRKENRRKRHCRDNNAKFSVDTRRKKASIKAKRKIKAGEEVFVSYGRDYWK